MSSFIVPLADLVVGAASHMADVQRKVDMLDQAKTVAESAAQLMYATKEGGGNPQVNTAFIYRLLSSKMLTDGGFISLRNRVLRRFEIDQVN